MRKVDPKRADRNAPCAASALQMRWPQAQNTRCEARGSHIDIYPHTLLGYIWGGQLLPRSIEGRSGACEERARRPKWGEQNSAGTARMWTDISAGGARLRGVKQHRTAPLGGLRRSFEGKLRGESKQYGVPDLRRHLGSSQFASVSRRLSKRLPHLACPRLLFGQAPPSDLDLGLASRRRPLPARDGRARLRDAWGH